MDQEMTQKERPSIVGGRKISRLRPPQISALAKNKFGFLKETTVTEKAEFEQLEKSESCRSIPCKSEQDLWKEMMGKPVCVGGIKKGILRYFGPTKFADGLWCGVELNDPIGKNDGTIDGMSYFNCKKQHGIFAPLSKVQPISPSDSLFATKLSNSVQQHNETITLHKDTAQTMHKQTYAGISENKIRTNSLKEPSKNLTFSAGFHNSTFSVGLRKPRDIRSFSASDQHSVVGVKHDSPYSTNKNNLTIVTSKESLEVNDNGPLHPDRNVDDCNMKRNDLCSGRNSKDCLVMNTTVNIEKSDLNTTFVLEDDLPEENEPVKSSDVLNTTFNLDSSVLNRNITQILPNKCTDQTNDFNTTFTFSELSTVGKVDKECFNESETENCSQEKVRKLSIDDLFTSDDIDDDQQSLDLDESLGILTPNQMKDFTVSIDQQSVIMLDGSISRIPKISSCDNIDDIPEDEVRDTFSHLSNDSNFYTRVLTEDNLEHALNSPSFPQTQLTEGKTFVRLVHQFDNGDGQEFSLDCRQTSTPCASGREIREDLSPISFNNIMDTTTNIDKSAKKFNFFLENKHSENLEFPNSEACATIEHIADDIEKSCDESVNNCPHIEHEKIPDCSLLVNMSTSSRDDSNNMHIKKAGEPFIKFENIMSNIMHEEKRADECINLLKEIPKSSSNSLDNSYNIADTTKIISTNNASSDKQICFENDCFEPDCLKTERPASTYTVGSTDTGYQEDGDFDVRSELSVATQSPCSELPAHSMYSSNRSMGIEDSERHPVVEIMSDSDFFTDSGGIGFTESEMETDGECKASNDFLQDSDKMCTVIEQSISENEDITSRVASEHGTPSEDHSVTSKFKEANETIILQSSTTLSSSTTESTKNSTINEDTANKITIESKNDQTDKNSKVEKINSFIMADKEETGNLSPLEKNIINNSGKRGLPNNKTVTKTQPEVPRNKRDNILKSKILNDNVITEKRARKNVVSKIKLMIESSPQNLINKNDENNPKSSRLPKKSRWEDVTSKIAASMAEDKTKLKEKKEIKSRIDTNLVGAKPVPSRRGSRLDSTRNSFSVKNENASGIDVPAAKNVRNINQRAKIQLPHHITDSEKTGNKDAPNTINRNQLKPSKSVSSTLSNASYSSSTSKQSSGTPQNNAPRTTTGVKSNVSKQDMSSTRKTSLRFSTTQTSGRTTKRDTTRMPSQPFTNASQTCIAKSPTAPASKNSPTSRTAPMPRCAIRANSTLQLKNISYLQLSEGFETEDGNQGRKNLPLTQKRPTFPNLDQKRPPLWASKTELSKEVQRLGALCEARTKELNLLKMQLRHATTGFEAFSVLVRYMSEDLDAFSHPKIAAQLKKTKEGLNKTLLQLKEYQDQIEDLKKHHAKEISNLTEKLSKVHDNELFNLKIQHTTELAEAKAQHEKKISEIHDTYKKTTVTSEQQYLQIVEELKREYMLQKQEMEQCHAEQLANTIQRHEDTKHQLIEQIKNLQDQYEELLQQAREMEDALHKSSDSKMQWISLKKAELEKEVDSLKVVLEMKQSEIRNLRRENLEMKKELEGLPLAKDKIQKLEARQEELEAIMETKSRAQSVLSTEHEQLKEYFEKESKFNKQLSMEKEELQWRLQQSLETTSLLSSLNESFHSENDSAAFPTRLSASYHSCTSKTYEKASPHHSATSSPYRPYRRSASLSDATISSSKKFRHVWDSSPLTENTKRPNLRSHSLLKAHCSHTSKHPRHRSFTLHSGKSFTDHIKSSEGYEESLQQDVVEKFGGRDADRKGDIASNKNQNNGTSNSVSTTTSSFTFSSTPHAGTDSGLPVHRFELTQSEDKSPIVKLFQNLEPDGGRTATSSDHSFNANNLKLIQMEYEKNMPLQKQVGEYFTKETQPEFVVVLETSNNIAAYKANIDQTEDGGLEEASKLSDSIEGSFTSPPDILDTSNNVSCSLQSSIISDDSAWSSTSFPPQAQFDVRSHDFVSPSSEDESFSNSSGGSHGNRAAAEGLNVSCGDLDESSSSVEHSRCVEGNCQYRSFSPKNLAGEAMVQDDSPLSTAQTSEELSVSVSRRKHKQRQKSEITEEDASKETWEISYYGLKERIVQSNNMDSPSIETTSQGHLMTNSNIDDISWDSEDMPSEPEE